MDQSLEWEAELERLASAAGEDGDGASPGTGEPDPHEGPSSKKWDSRPERGRWLAGGQLAAADEKVDWRVHGWVAKQGTSVWFGAGSTGKTQLMLWMAAMIASRIKDRREHVWLGGRIEGTGHVLILTAEDTREQIMKRLDDVVRHSMGQDEDARRRTLERLHVMPFLSMSEREFEHPNPSLFEHALQENKDRVWSPTHVMLEIRRYVKEWNRVHDADDRIVGVVMDSATSMAGFDSLDAQATTNFFFYLGRLCERLSVFWAIIGHTPKVTAVPRHTARETATSRLRGVAMWTTAPRLTVEVRLAQEWRERKGVARENEDLRLLLDGRVRRENILVVYVAKANLQQAHRDERFLVRLRQGAFIDVTRREDAMDAILSGVLDPDEADLAGDRSATEGSAAGAPPTPPQAGSAATRPASAPSRARAKPRPTAAGRPKLDPAAFQPGTTLVLETIRATYRGDREGVRVSANRIKAAVAGVAAADPRAALVTRAWGGGERPARVGAINWHLDRLAADGSLRKVDRFYYLADATRASG